MKPLCSALIDSHQSISYQLYDFPPSSLTPPKFILYAHVTMMLLKYKSDRFSDQLAVAFQ